MQTWRVTPAPYSDPLGVNRAGLRGVPGFGPLMTDRDHPPGSCPSPNAFGLLATLHGHLRWMGCGHPQPGSQPGKGGTHMIPTFLTAHVLYKRKLIAKTIFTEEKAGRSSPSGREQLAAPGEGSVRVLLSPWMDAGCVHASPGHQPLQTLQQCPLQIYGLGPPEFGVLAWRL